MTSYITIIRAILKDNDLHADAQDVLDKMKARMGGSIDDLTVLSFIRVCLEAEKVMRP